MAQYRMLIDPEKCMNCRACLVGCQQRNAVPYGYFRNWVRNDTDPNAKSGWSFQPGGCMQCAEPLCVQACPTQATWKAQDGITMIDSSRCIGCGACIKACPYNARYRHPEKGIADKCDYCASTRQLGQEPACVQLCATKARIFGDISDPASEASQLINKGGLYVIEAKNCPTKPTLAYTNKPKNTDWPDSASLPLPISLMRPVATMTKWLGSLVLIGILGVIIKQIFNPSLENPPPGTQVNPQGGKTDKNKIQEEQND